MREPVARTRSNARAWLGETNAPGSKTAVVIGPEALADWAPRPETARARSRATASRTRLIVHSRAQQGIEPPQPKGLTNRSRA